MKLNVSAIVTHGNKILLIKRHAEDKHFPDRWGIPGGGMEAHDTSIEAVAIREVLEEVGMRIVPQQIRYNNRHNDVVFIVLTAKLADAKDFSSKPKKNSEIQTYEWVDSKSLNDKEFTPFTRERIMEVVKELPND